MLGCERIEVALASLKNRCRAVGLSINPGAPDFIDVVRPGLPARVRLTAYKVRRHFTLQGTVTQVSPDTFKEERTGRSYYKLRVEVPDAELQAAGGMTLAPGMLAQVEIVTGERSALRYLLDPLIDSAHRAMKEK